MWIKLLWSVRQLLLDAFVFTVEYKLLGNTSFFAGSLPRIIKDKEYDYLNTFLINSVKSFIIVFVFNDQNKVIFLHVLLLDKRSL